MKYKKQAEKDAVRYQKEEKKRLEDELKRKEQEAQAALDRQRVKERYEKMQEAKRNAAAAKIQSAWRGRSQKQSFNKVLAAMKYKQQAAKDAIRYQKEEKKRQEDELKRKEQEARQEAQVALD